MKAVQSWAIIVGINQYSPLAGQAELKGAAADAADFADWALDPHGGAVDPARLHFWTYPEPANPTKRLADYLETPTPWWDLDEGKKAPDMSAPPKYIQIVETALAAGTEARDATMQGDAGDVYRIYVFFAGHGLQTNTIGSAMEIQTCFVAGDFRPKAQTVMGLIPCEDLRRALLAGGFDQVFMFLDCCRVAMTKLNMPAPNIASPSTRQPPEQIWGVGSAAQKNKVAFETTAVPTRGAFSKALIEGLRTVRAPVTQELTLESLKIYVRDNIKAYIQEDQRPNFVGEPTDPSPLVLKGPPQSAPESTAQVRITFDSVAAGTKVQLSDDKGNPVGKPITAGPDVVLRQAVVDHYYSLDVIGASVSKAFRHPGPGVTDVSF